MQNLSNFFLACAGVALCAVLSIDYAFATSIVVGACAMIFGRRVGRVWWIIACAGFVCFHFVAKSTVLRAMERRADATTTIDHYCRCEGTGIIEQSPQWDGDHEGFTTVVGSSDFSCEGRKVQGIVHARLYGVAFEIVRGQRLFLRVTLVR